MITPLKRLSRFKGELVGFDTEYVSKTGQYLCYQLGYAGRGVLITKRITIDGIASECIKLIGYNPGHIALISYWSLAELQFLPVRTESFNWREYGTGSFDCDFYSDKCKLTLSVFDLARFFDRQSLAKVGETFEMPKLEYDTRRVTRCDLARRQFRTYAINDAIITEGIARKLRASFLEREVDIIQTATPANTAASVFRRECVKEEIRNDNNRARLAGMRACWGGRAEALERGSFRMLYEYDLKSAYPNAAISLGSFPVGENWKEITTFRQMNKCIGGFADVSFNFPAEEKYPSLLVACKSGQIYPISGREWATFDEVRYAAEIGATICLHEAWGFSRGSDLLPGFMQKTLAERAGATGARSVMLKLLANSLIGKLAQRTYSRDLDKLAVKAEEIGCSLEELFALSFDEQAALGIEPQISVGAIFMPEWNALITGRVRAQISELARETEAVYIATDAVWTPRKLRVVPKGYSLARSGPGIVARTRLGMILDNEENPHLAHHSIWNRKAALRALQSLDTPLRYLNRRPIKVREALRKGLKLGGWVNEYRSADARWDNKRKLLPDGKSVPWRDVSEYEAAAAEEIRSRKQRRKECPTK